MNLFSRYTNDTKHLLFLLEEMYDQNAIENLYLKCKQDSSLQHKKTILYLQQKHDLKATDLICLANKFANNTIDNDKEDFYSTAFPQRYNVLMDNIKIILGITECNKHFGSSETNRLHLYASLLSSFILRVVRYASRETSDVMLLSPTLQAIIIFVMSIRHSAMTTDKYRTPDIFEMTALTLQHGICIQQLPYLSCLTNIIEIIVLPCQGNYCSIFPTAIDMLMSLYCKIPVRGDASKTTNCLQNHSPCWNKAFINVHEKRQHTFKRARDIILLSISNDIVIRMDPLTVAVAALLVACVQSQDNKNVHYVTNVELFIASIPLKQFSTLSFFEIDFVQVIKLTLYILENIDVNKV